MTGFAIAPVLTGGRRAPPPEAHPPRVKRWLPLLVLVVGALLALGLVRWLQVVEAPRPQLATQFECDFRGSKPIPPEMYLAGAVGNAEVRPEPEGLRITLKGDRPNPIGRVGLEMKTVVRGDFEIMAGYEILQGARPTKGYGVGFEMFAHTLHTPQRGIGAYRMARVKEGDVYFISRSYHHDDGTPGWEQDSLATSATAGRLRLTRTGNEVTAWAAEGIGPFKELRTMRLGPEDITVLWFMAYTGHQAYPLDLRITDVAIRSTGTLPAPAAAAGDSAPPASSKYWRLLALALLLLLMAAAGLWLYLRRRGDDAP